MECWHPTVAHAGLRLRLRRGADQVPGQLQVHRVRRAELRRVQQQVPHSCKRQRDLRGGQVRRLLRTRLRRLRWSLWRP